MQLLGGSKRGSYWYYFFREREGKSIPAEWSKCSKLPLVS